MYYFSVVPHTFYQKRKFLMMVSAEQKVQLVHFLREDNKKNRIQLHRREQILYGKNVPELNYEETVDDGYDTKDLSSYKGKGISGFRIRFMISVILFLSFFYLDRNDEKIGNIDTSQIESYMEDDSLQCLVTNVFDFNE